MNDPEKHEPAYVTHMLDQVRCIQLFYSTHAKRPPEEDTSEEPKELE